MFVCFRFALFALWGVLCWVVLLFLRLPFAPPPNTYYSPTVRGVTRPLIRGCIPWVSPKKALAYPTRREGEPSHLVRALVDGAVGFVVIPLPPPTPFPSPTPTTPSRAHIQNTPSPPRCIVDPNTENMRVMCKCPQLV